MTPQAIIDTLKRYRFDLSTEKERPARGRPGARSQQDPPRARVPPG